MSKTSVKEIKGVQNFGFYPEHYLSTALLGDAKTKHYTGESLKNLKKDIVKSLHALNEKGTPELIEEIAKATFKALGFYDVKPLENSVLEAQISGKSVFFPVERLLSCAGGDSATIAMIISTGELTSCEHFFERPSPYLIKAEDKSSLEYYPWSKVISELFNSDHCHAEWLLISSGSELYLLERGRWQETQSYIAFDLVTLFEVNSDDAYQIVESLVATRSFPIQSAESFHDIVGRNAHKKAAEVTKALRDSVRESVEILANQILETHKASPIISLKSLNWEDRESREEIAKLIFDQSLRYIYRMLFMLFTESQDANKNNLPVAARAYQLGYGIEKLRNLELVPFASDQGNFIQQSLEKSFAIYFGGYRTEQSTAKNNATGQTEVITNALGFSFPAIGTDLFSQEKTSLFQFVKIPDRIMQTVIKKLSLAKVGTGKTSRTYRVHYAGLGLNQLGAVYEGLLSLKPVILTERVILLEKDKKDAAYSYIPYANRNEYDENMFAKNEEDQVFDRKAGEFMLAPVGLERKFSASFYTPEVLTRFVAKEAVDILLEKDSSLQRMENLKICEPAMGSGAFLNAVVDEVSKRMAQQYYKIDQLKRDEIEKESRSKDASLGAAHTTELKDISHYISKAKEHLMTHAVYGVDLNPTAVELAKISLWLNCLHENGNLPFLDFKLKHGNSLVGAWLKRHEITVDGKNYPHFLLPHAFALEPHLEGKILNKKDMPFISDSGTRQKMSDLQKSWQDALTNTQWSKRLEKLNKKVIGLYEQHLVARKSYREALASSKNAEEKMQTFQKFLKEDTAYNQLRAMMDYWCSLWFWPHEELSKLPTVDAYLTGLEWMADSKLTYDHETRQQMLKESGLKELLVSRSVSKRHCFFHWDLEFVEVFAEGGFDLVIGNPPWAKVIWEEADFFEAVHPGAHAKKADSKVRQDWYLEELKKDKNLAPRYIDAKTSTLGLVGFLKESATYPVEDQSNTNTYKYFHQRFMSISKSHSCYGMIAQDGIFTDDGNLKLRKLSYRELTKAYRFHNELRYFEDIGNTVQFMVSFYIKDKEKVNASILDNLLDMSTVALCRSESENAPYVGMKNSEGEWDLRGHPHRIVTIDEALLKSLVKFTPELSWEEMSLPIIHGKYELNILQSLAEHPVKLGDREWYCTQNFNETNSPKAGHIKRAPGKAKSIEQAVFTGPNIFIGNPANKSPNPGCKNHRDFTPVDLTKIPVDYYPDSVYQCTDKGLQSREYLAQTPWGSVHNKEYRFITRGLQVNTTGARTFACALLPRYCSHISTQSSISFKNSDQLVQYAGLSFSIILDFFVRSCSGGTISKGLLSMMPILTEKQSNSPLASALMIRALRLSCISNHFADLWKSVWKPEFCELEFNSEYAPKLPYSKLKNTWTYDSCIRDPKQREQALCEIDAIVANLFGFDPDTLLKLYRAQFGVLQSNLQDLPGQKVDTNKFHFPRYQQMQKAMEELFHLIGPKNHAA